MVFANTASYLAVAVDTRLWRKCYYHSRDFELGPVSVSVTIRTWYELKAANSASVAITTSNKIQKSCVEISMRTGFSKVRLLQIGSASDVPEAWLRHTISYHTF